MKRKPLFPTDKDLVLIHDESDWSGSGQVFADQHEAFEFWRDHPNRGSCSVTAFNAAEGWSRPLEDDFDDQLSHAEAGQYRLLGRISEAQADRMIRERKEA